MKIGLYTLPRPPSLGGGFVLRDDLARAAIKLKGRHQFELVTIPPPDEPPPPLPPPPPPKGWVRRKLDSLRRAPTPPPSLPLPSPPSRSPEQRFRDEVAARKFDLIWFNNFDPIYVGAPFVMNIFDLQHRVHPFFPEVSNDGQWEHRDNVYGDASRRAAFVTVGSWEAKQQLCHFYGVPEANIRVLPFPTPQKAIDIATGEIQAQVTENVREKYGIGNDFLFYPAQFWPHKNHVNLLLALKVLKARGRRISLALTGSDHGNQFHVNKLAQDLGLADLVHFCGFVPYEDILAFYRQARALSYLSFFGPENLPPLEAMALECPVIMSDMPGVKALYGDAPVYVAPHDPVSIADGIEYVIDHPAQMRPRIQMGKDIALNNSCARYLESFQAALDEFEAYRRCWP